MTRQQAVIDALETEKAAQVKPLSPTAQARLRGYNDGLDDAKTIVTSILSAGLTEEEIDKAVNEIMLQRLIIHKNKHDWLWVPDDKQRDELIRENRDYAKAALTTVFGGTKK